MADETESLPPWFHFVQSEFEKQNMVIADQNQQTRREFQDAVDRLVTKESFEAERRYQEKEMELVGDRLKRAEEKLSEQLSSERRSREDAIRLEAETRKEAILAESTARRELAEVIERNAETQRTSRRALWSTLITVGTTLILAGATLAAVVLPVVLPNANH